jgi:hypothetical protein
MKVRKIRRKYSGPGSLWFWNRVKKLPDESHDEVYALGCALQDLEERVLNSLAQAEFRKKQQPDGDA